MVHSFVPGQVSNTHGPILPGLDYLTAQKTDHLTQFGLHVQPWPSSLNQHKLFHQSLPLRARHL